MTESAVPAFGNSQGFPRGRICIFHSELDIFINVERDFRAWAW